MKYKFTRWCISCSCYKPAGGPPKTPWRCADCRKAIAERCAKLRDGDRVRVSGVTGTIEANGDFCDSCRAAGGSMTLAEAIEEIERERERSRGRINRVGALTEVLWLLAKVTDVQSTQKPPDASVKIAIDPWAEFRRDLR